MQAHLQNATVTIIRKDIFDTRQQPCCVKGCPVIQAIAYLESEENCVRLAPETNTGRSLFHSFHGIFNLKDPPLRGPHSDVRVVLIPELFSQAGKGGNASTIQRQSASFERKHASPCMSR